MDQARKKLLAIYLGAALVIQASVYFYLDQVLFAPATSFSVSAASDTHMGGKVYYSRDKRYMAVVKTGVVEIMAMPSKKIVRTIETGEQQVSFFKWLDDRDLALMAVHTNGVGKDDVKVVLRQINPLTAGHEVTTTVEKLPTGSKVTDVAFSTATNVVYMQILTAVNPDLYRIYRFDANHDLARVYLQSNKINRIGVLYDQDSLVYDNLTDGTIIVRDGDGSWRIISPPAGKYRLVGVDQKTNTIYIAKLNANGLVDLVLKGKLKQGFETHRTMTTPVDLATLKVSDVI